MEWTLYATPAELERLEQLVRITDAARFASAERRRIYDRCRRRLRVAENASLAEQKDATS